MSTLRRDPATDEWVILAPRRADRPHLQRPAERAPEPAFDPKCPFCPGNEHMTPPEITRVPEDGIWRMRVVPNLFPVLHPDGTEGAAPSRPASAFEELPGTGAHEVIIETPRHDARIDRMPGDEVTGVLELWMERYRVLGSREDVRFVQVFKNFGLTAGTSLSHPHSQIIATPLMPPEPERMFAMAERHRRSTGASPYSDLLRSERSAGERVVVEQGPFVALCPFAGRTPFETWILPTDSQASFIQASGEDLSHLAAMLTLVTRGLRRAAGDPDYNLVLASAPPDEPGEAFRWHLRLIPRLSTTAGFELGSGMFINAVRPEDAARAMKDALAQ